MITGAASGIGGAFADRVASRGLPLVLVDRDREGLERKASSLRRGFGVDVGTIVGDLAESAFVASVAGLAEEREIGLLVHAAGISALGRFVDLPLEPQLVAVDLHCRTSLHLTHAFGRAMRRRGRGGIVLLSSNSALLRAPLIANYAATKAYTLTLAEALWEELRHEGVDVLGLVPGMTETPMLAASRPDARRSRGMIQSPEAVVDGALAHLGKTPIHVSSVADRIAAGLFSRLLPKAWSLPLARRGIAYFYPHLEGER